MAITPVNNLTHLKADASPTYTVSGTNSDNRVLFLITSDMSGNPYACASVTFGAQAATALDADIMAFGGGQEHNIGLWYIKEADIPAGSNAVVTTWTFNEGGGSVSIPATAAIMAFHSSGVDQAGSLSVATNIAQRDGGPETVTLDHGVNNGKYALSFVFTNAASDTNDESWTATPDTGVSALAAQSNLSILPYYNATYFAAQYFDTLSQDNQVISWDLDYNNSGTDLNGNKLNVMAALIMEAAGAAPATLTIDQTTIEPGGAITGSYTNFTAGVPPTTPLILTDSGGNTLSVTVTPSDNANGTGTFSGTIPSLPAAGNSGTFVLFGNVTATLDDA